MNKLSLQPERTRCSLPFITTHRRLSYNLKMLVEFLLWRFGVHTDVAELCLLKQQHERRGSFKNTETLAAITSCIWSFIPEDTKKCIDQAKCRICNVDGTRVEKMTEHTETAVWSLKGFIQHLITTAAR